MTLFLEAFGPLIVLAGLGALIGLALLPMYWPERR